MNSKNSCAQGRFYLATAVQHCGLLTLLSMALLIALPGCGGRHDASVQRLQNATEEHAQPASGQFGIPAPGQLAGLLAPDSRRTSYVPADFYKAGEAFNSVLPHNKVTAAVTGAQFAPDWTPASPDISGLSYAMYDFRIPGFDLNPSIEYAWNTAPTDFGEVFIGLANWDINRWDWYQANAVGRLDFASFGDYFDFGGDILVCVVITGTAVSELDWLRIASIPPVVALTASVHYGFTPLTVSFDAAGSTDADGAIAEYRWDPEGDGSFDQTTGTVPQLEFTYEQNGDLHPAVRVVDDDGVSTDQALSVSAYDNSFITLGTASIEEEVDCAIVRPDGKLLLFGRSRDQIQSQAHITVAVMSPNGTLDSVRQWSGGTDNDRLGDVVMGYDGSFYVCGWTSPGGLVQKWSPEGELIWSKQLLGLSSMVLNRIGQVDGLIVCSGFAVPSGGGISPVVTCLDAEGNVAWTRVISAPQSSQFADLATYSSIAIGGSSVRLCGNYVPGAGQYSYALYSAFGTDGSLKSSKLLGGDTATYATGITVAGFTLPATYILGQHGMGTTSYEAFLSRLGGSTSVISDPAYIYNTDGLQLTGAGALAAIIRCSTNLADQYGALALLKLDTSFNLLSGNLLSATPNGGSAALNIGSVLGQGLVISGQHAGALPATTSYTPIPAVSALAWFDFAPTILEPTVSSLSTSVELTDISGYEINRGSDIEGFIYVEKN